MACSPPFIENRNSTRLPQYLCNGQAQDIAHRVATESTRSVHDTIIPTLHPIRCKTCRKRGYPLGMGYPLQNRTFHGV